MGDFNVDYLSNNSDTKRLIRSSESNSLIQTIDTPTSLIDMNFCNVTHISTSGVIDMILSDHQPVYLIKKMNLGKNKTKRTVVGRTYMNYTPTAMQNLIDKNIDINQLMSDREPVKCWDNLYQSL